MEEYYQRIQDKLLIQKEIIDALLKNQNTGVRSDYYEAIVRDLVRENVPKAFSVSRGIILNKEGQNSEECDLILYESSSFDAWFQSGEIVVVSPEAVRAVIEVKRTLNHRNIHDAISNLEHVDSLRRGIFKFIVGFSTNTQYDTLVHQCIQSKTVNSMFVFNTNRAQNDRIIESEMERFMGIIKQITSTILNVEFSAGAYYIHQVEKPINITRSELIVEDGFHVTKFDNEPNVSRS